MKKIFSSLSWAILAFAFLDACTTRPGSAPTVPSTEAKNPFKLAQYKIFDETRVAILVSEKLYDLRQLHELTPGQDRDGQIQMPSTMLELIGKYSALNDRLYQLANFASDDVSASSLLQARLDAENIQWQPPVLYPWNLLNVAVNYRRHGAEMGHEPDVDYDKDEPFVFAKSPRASMIPSGEKVMIPPGRHQIDWEVELAVVMGKKATRVSGESALDFVFGYTLLLDISDRGPKNRKDPRFNVDWFSSKSRDGFAPVGPLIVPAEFVADPNDLDLRLSVNGELMQDSNTSYMVHNVQSLISYITSIQTLEPGDMIATGTPAGVGAGRQPPIFLKPGDVITAEIEKICEIRTPIG